MKIFVPVKDKDSIEILAEHGAGEFYGGVIYKKWEEEFGSKIEYNRRGTCREKANFNNFNDLSDAILKAHKYNKDFYLTINHHQFSERQLPYIRHLINEFKMMNGDGIIVSDLNAMDYGASLGLKVACSTDLCVYNSETVKFLERRGVTRIIFSRDMTLEQMNQIMKKVPNLEYECFMINGPCKFSDSMCLPLHSTKYGAFCRFLESCEYTFFDHQNPQISKQVNKLLQDNIQIYHGHLFNRACGICAIDILLNMGIHSCKLVGRVLPLEQIIDELDLIKRNLDIAMQCKSHSEYIKKIDIGTQNARIPCEHGFQCYYPEARKGL